MYVMGDKTIFVLILNNINNYEISYVDKNLVKLNIVKMF